MEAVDTAISAKEISEEGLKYRGAIASKRAARLYGLDILAEGIETNKKNYTRFLILSNEKNYEMERIKNGINKASIAFTLPHETGSLSAVLVIFLASTLDL